MNFDSTIHTIQYRKTIQLAIRPTHILMHIVDRVLKTILDNKSFITLQQKFHNVTNKVLESFTLAFHIFKYSFIALSNFYLQILAHTHFFFWMSPHIHNCSIFSAKPSKGVVDRPKSKDNTIRV